MLRELKSPVSQNRALYILTAMSCLILVKRTWKCYFYLGRGSGEQQNYDCFSDTKSHGLLHTLLSQALYLGPLTNTSTLKTDFLKYFKILFLFSWFKNWQEMLLSFNHHKIAIKWNWCWRWIAYLSYDNFVVESRLCILISLILYLSLTLDKEK